MATSKISERCVFICLLALTTVTYVTPVSNSACICSLGMEDGRIKDSQITTSSVHRNTTAVGGQARLRKNIPSWAGWCPNVSGGIKTERNYDQYIQIDLLKLTKITGIATQGRGFNATVSRVKDYKLSYSRDNKTWNFYQEKKQSDKIFRENTNVTSTVVRNDLDLAIMARYIRIHPGYRKDYAVCMRLEIYGDCVDKEVILSYSMPVGQTTKNRKVHYKDTSYDGEIINDFYKNGTGILTDGKFGPDMPKARKPKGKGWVGWNLTQFQYIDITFEFSCVRKFTDVKLTVNVDKTPGKKRRDHAVFNRSQIFFSSTKDSFSDTSFLQYFRRNNQTKTSPYNVNVTLPLCENTARFIKLRLYLGGKWLLITEISFNSVAASENEKNCLQNCSNWGHTSCVSTKPVEDSTNSTALFVGIIGITPAIVFIFFVIFIIYKRRRQASKLSTAMNPVGIENQAVHTETESHPNNNQRLGHVRRETANSDHSSGYVIPLANGRTALYAEVQITSPPSVYNKLNRNRPDERATTNPDHSSNRIIPVNGRATPYKVVQLVSPSSVYDKLNINRAEGRETINSDRSSGYEDIPPVPGYTELDRNRSDETTNNHPYQKLLKHDSDYVIPAHAEAEPSHEEDKEIKTTPGYTELDNTKRVQDDSASYQKLIKK